MECLPERVSLTAREAEALRLAAAEMTPREIADELNISYNTARNHISNMMQKFGTTNRLSMVVAA